MQQHNSVRNDDEHIVISLNLGLVAVRTGRRFEDWAVINCHKDKCMTCDRHKQTYRHVHHWHADQRGESMPAISASAQLPAAEFEQKLRKVFDHLGAARMQHTWWHGCGGGQLLRP